MALQLFGCSEAEGGMRWSTCFAALVAEPAKGTLEYDGQCQTSKLQTHRTCNPMMRSEGFSVAQLSALRSASTIA